MNVDAWMPLYGNDLFSACEGYSDAVTLGYVRALWHYWHHAHCEGLPDDDDYLRRVCRCEPAAWVRTKGVIFGEFFKLAGGKWQQKRSAEEYHSAVESAKRRTHQTEAARLARQPTAVVTKPVTEPVTERQSQSQSHSHSEAQPEPPSQSQKHPEESVCVNFPLAKQKQDLQNGQRFKWLEVELCRLYKRPRPNVGRGEEEHLVSEVARRPDVKPELEELKRARITMGERFFPQSLLALCRDWDKTLDRARNQKPAPKPRAERTIQEKELDRLERIAERL